MRKRVRLTVAVFVLTVVPALPALACGGLVGPRGAVNLTRTTTLAAYHNGIEHYVTAFNYAGGGGKFGSIVPLPAMPSKVERGGDWTLQRLQRETSPPRREVTFAAAASSDNSAQEVYKTRIDALDITVLKGGGKSVALWATQHGFTLSPDAPGVLDFYAARSPFFMAAVFDSKAAEKRGQQIGDGTPIHITTPLRAPWVPLRILGLGKASNERVDADVYLLTDRAPKLLPRAGRGYTVERQVSASTELLRDLRSDKGMGWMPASGMTLTHLVVASTAPELRYDLAISVGRGTPPREATGLAPLPTPVPTPLPTVAPTPTLTPIVAPTTLATAPLAASRPVWPMALAASLVALSVICGWRIRRRGRARS